MTVARFLVSPDVPDATTDGEALAYGQTELVVTWPTGSEPSLAGVPDGTLWVEYTP